MEIKARTRDLDQIQQIDLDPKVRTFLSNVHHRLMFSLFLFFVEIT